MPNTIKHSGEGLALQVTKPARAAGLVEENADGAPTRRAAVLVYAFAPAPTHVAAVADGLPLG